MTDPNEMVTLSDGVRVQRKHVPWLSSGSDLPPKGTTLTPAKEELFNLGYVKLRCVAIATPFLRDEVATVLASAIDALRAKEYLHNPDVAIAVCILADVRKDLLP